MLFLKTLDKSVKGCREEDSWLAKMPWKFFEDLAHPVSCLVTKVKEGGISSLPCRNECFGVLKRFWQPSESGVFSS